MSGCLPPSCAVLWRAEMSCPSVTIPHGLGIRRNFKVHQEQWSSLRFLHSLRPQSTLYPCTSIKGEFTQPLPRFASSSASASNIRRHSRPNSSSWSVCPALQATRLNQLADRGRQIASQPEITSCSLWCIEIRWVLLSGIIPKKLEVSVKCLSIQLSRGHEGFRWGRRRNLKDFDSTTCQPKLCLIAQIFDISQLPSFLVT